VRHDEEDKQRDREGENNAGGGHDNIRRADDVASLTLGLSGGRARASSEAWSWTAPY